MGSGIYNCEYEQLVGIALIERMTLGEKAELAKKGATLSEIERLLGGIRCRMWEKELAWADDDSEGIRRGHVFYGEDDYPKGLIDDASAPFALAWKGVEPKGANGDFRKAESLTVVGTRESSAECREAAYLLSIEAAANGIVVYSGYATGIDQAAHNGACSAGGATIAVMPCGFSNDYAFRNRALAERIYAAGGGFISQFTADEEPRKWNFYYRNRILARITDATVVVEAPEHSGALITVREALDAGRDVFVHQAGLGAGLSRKGTQGLADDGAISISSYAELSRYTLGSFRGERRVEPVSYAEIERIIRDNPDHEPFYRFRDRWFRVADAAAAEEK